MQPARNLPGRLSQSPGATDRGNDRHTGQNSGLIDLEQGFEGTRLNTGTMSDLQTLADTCWRTSTPSGSPPRCPLSRPNLQPCDWWAMAKARRAEKRVLYEFRDRLRRVLIQHRHRFIDCQEPDPEGGWRLHIFVLDEDALPLLDGIDGRRCEVRRSGDFDPEQFVIERLRELEWSSHD